MCFARIIFKHELIFSYICAAFAVLVNKNKAKLTHSTETNLNVN